MSDFFYIDDNNFADMAHLQAEWLELEKIEDINKRDYNDKITFISDNNKTLEQKLLEMQRAETLFYLQAKYESSKNERYKDLYDFTSDVVDDYLQWKKLNPYSSFRKFENFITRKYKNLDATINYKIYFSFNGYRNPRSSNGGFYGSDDEAKKIYSTLCNYYNGGVSFISDYLHNDYKARIADEVHSMLKRHFRNKSEDTEYISDFIVDDIKVCMQSGILPIKFKISESTLYSRRLAGIETDTPFYATGNLLDCLHFTFKEEKAS